MTQSCRTPQVGAAPWPTDDLPDIGSPARSRIAAKMVPATAWCRDGSGKGCLDHLHQLEDVRLPIPGHGGECGEGGGRVHAASAARLLPWGLLSLGPAVISRRHSWDSRR